MKKKISIFIGIVLLLIAGIKWAWHLPNVMDITFGDEAQYLRYGLDLFEKIQKDWGPSYNIWYKFLSLIQSNPIRLFYFNYQVTAILIAILLFIFLIRYEISFTISLWMSFCFLFTTTVIDTWPRVSHFAVIVLLFFLIAVKKIQSDAKKLLLITLAFFIAAYARPELFSSFLLMSLVTVFFLVKERTTYKNWMPIVFLVASIILLIFFIYQLPANSYKGIDRTYIAFSQHYAINYVIENKANFNPISEWIDFAKSTFGDCTNFGCILQSHPELVLHHALLNVKLYALTLMQFITGVLFPTAIIGKRVIHLLVFVGFLFLLGFVLFDSSCRRKLIQQLKSNSLLLLTLFLFGLPSIGTSIIIFPRQHYLLMHSILLMYLIALVLNSVLKTSNINPVFALILVAVFIVKSPKAQKYNYYQLDRESKNQCNKKLTEYLTHHNDKKPHTVFSNHLSLSMMLPSNFSDFNTEYEYKPGIQFSTILKKKKIDYIVIRDILMQEKLINRDSTWINFMKSPESYGFKKQIYCDSCASYLLIKTTE